MNLLLAAASGWGKSCHAQSIMESSRQSGEYDHTAILDFCDEYRGLVKAGYCKHLIVGEREAEWSVEQWRDVFQQEPHLVLARVEDMAVETWREVCNRVVKAVRRLSNPLVAIDEAHFIAPQQTKLPPAIKGLATTGRGEGASALWITQRLTEIDSTPVTQCQSRMVGGFTDDNDTGRIASSTPYNEDAHLAGGNPVSGLPDDLHADDEGAISVRKFEDDTGSTVGSEWIYSSDSGEMRRVDTTGITDRMESTHYGQEGNDLHLPEYA